jgi:outer membrane protein assembly factor BamA
MFRVATTLLCIFLASSLAADCGPDFRSNKKSGFFIQDFIVNGTSSLSSQDLLNIRSKLIGACIDEQSDLEQLVKESFQNEGYYAAVVKDLETHMVDALAQPKTINVEADVAEGQIYKLGAVRFIGNHAFEEARLRNAFQLRKGEKFNRSTLARGLGSIRKLYLHHGFADLAFIPDDTADFGNSEVNLIITIVEGPQYHMGKLVIVGKQDELAAQLQTAWGMGEGKVFDFGYPQEYLKANQQLLPVSFSQNDLQIIRNCPEATATVWLILQERDLGSQTPPRPIDCEESHDKK